MFPCATRYMFDCLLTGISISHVQRPLRALSAGLAHLRELSLDDNQLLSLAPLSALPSLEVLSAAQNRLQTLAGLGTLSGLRSLDVRCNELGSLEEFAVVQGAQLLGELALAGNPMEKVGGAECSRS